MSICSGRHRHIGQTPYAAIAGRASAEGGRPDGALNAGPGTPGSPQIYERRGRSGGVRTVGAVGITTAAGAGVGKWAVEGSNLRPWD